MFGPKKNSDPKKCLDQKIFWTPKKIGPQKIKSKNFWDPKKFSGPKKIFDPKKILGPTNFGCEKILDPKKNFRP